MDDKRNLIRRELKTPYGDWSTKELVARPAAVVFRYATVGAVGVVSIVAGVVQQWDWLWAVGGVLAISGTFSSVVAARLALNYEAPVRWGLEEYEVLTEERPMPMTQIGANTLRLWPRRFRGDQLQRLAGHLRRNNWRWSRRIIMDSGLFDDVTNDTYGGETQRWVRAGVVEPDGNGYRVRLDQRAEFEKYLTDRPTPNGYGDAGASTTDDDRSRPVVAQE